MASGAAPPLPSAGAAGRGATQGAGVAEARAGAAGAFGMRCVVTPPALRASAGFSVRHWLQKRAPARLICPQLGHVQPWPSAIGGDPPGSSVFSRQLSVLSSQFSVVSFQFSVSDCAL